MTDPFNKQQSATPANQPLLPGAGGIESFGTIDLEGVESSSLIDAGTYMAYLDHIESGTTKNGDPKLVWFFRLIDHPKHAGRQLSLHTSFVPAALFRLKQVQEAMGQTGAKFNPTTELYNTLVVLKVTVSEFEGRSNNQIDGVFPAPDQAGGPGAKYKATTGVPA